MKIHEVEKQLAITKANIRFYEKEGLITPNRTEKGYREYSEEDMERLKQIVILRKLGIPVQQIADLLDGALPLQEALNQNITVLQAEIERLNGSLALCRQLVQEDAQILDTERYWEILQSQEKQGYRFQSLIEDYLNFSEIGYEWFLWPLPAESLRSPWKVAVYGAVLSGITALGGSFVMEESFFSLFFRQSLRFLGGIGLWTAVFIHLYFLSKRKPKLAEQILWSMIIAIHLGVLALICWGLCRSWS